MDDKEFLFNMLRSTIHISKVQFKSDKRGGFTHFLERLREAITSPDLKTKDPKKRDFCESKIFCELRKLGFCTFDPWAATATDGQTEHFAAIEDPAVIDLQPETDDLLPEERLKRSYTKQNLI